MGGERKLKGTEGSDRSGSPSDDRLPGVARLSRLPRLLLLLLLAGAACEQERAIPPVPAPRGEAIDVYESPSMQYLPRPTDLEGWTLDGDPEVIPAKRFPSWMHNDADHFLAYEALDVVAADYVRDPAGFATVEIFRFSDFVKAFGAYSTRRKGVISLLDLGNESFIAPHSIHVWSGPFYVRVIGGGAPELIEPMKQLASAVVDSMPAAEAKPAVFRFFPEGQRVANSDTYQAEPVFGHPFFRNAFTSEFRVAEANIDGMILPAAGKSEAEEALNRYRDFYRSNGRLLDPVPNLGEDNFTGEDEHVGRTVAFRIDRFVVAFRGFVDKQTLIDLAIATDQRILNAIRTELQEAERRARVQRD